MYKQYIYVINIYLYCDSCTITLSPLKKKGSQREVYHKLGHEQT
jgi:hypothetical protein